MAEKSGPLQSRLQPGWTARDEFAKAAMQGLLANDTRDGEFRNYAADAYAVADAMLKERGGAP